MRLSGITIKRYLSKDKKIYTSIIMIHFKSLFGKEKDPKRIVTVIELDTGYHLKHDIHFDNFDEWLRNECDVISREIIREGIHF